MGFQMGINITGYALTTISNVDTKRLKCMIPCFWDVENFVASSSLPDMAAMHAYKVEFLYNALSGDQEMQVNKVVVPCRSQLFVAEIERRRPLFRYKPGKSFEFVEAGHETHKLVKSSKRQNQKRPCCKEATLLLVRILVWVAVF
jgi:hypothetical protein